MALRELLQTPWPVAPVSVVTPSGFSELGRRTFAALSIIRIYNKEPGREPDRDRPFTLPQGSTVADLAATIHNDIAAKLKFARVWGRGAFGGQVVGEAHVLVEGDVVEIHTLARPSEALDPQESARPLAVEELKNERTRQSAPCRAISVPDAGP